MYATERVTSGNNKVVNPRWPPWTQWLSNVLVSVYNAAETS